MKNLLLLVLLCFSFQTKAQIELQTLNEVKAYLEGDWQLTSFHNGWGGETIFPTETEDYTFRFENVDGGENTMICTGYLNEEILESREVSIEFHETFKWGITNIPALFDFQWQTFFMFESQIETDSFAVHDASADGNTLRLKREVSTSVINQKPFEVKLYPNPTADFINIKITNAVKINKINIYKTNGQLIMGTTSINENRIKLPEHNGFMILEMHLSNGQIETRSVSKY